MKYIDTDESMITENFETEQADEIAESDSFL